MKPRTRTTANSRHSVARFPLHWEQPMCGHQRQVDQFVEPHDDRRTTRTKGRSPLTNQHFISTSSSRQAFLQAKRSYQATTNLSAFWTWNTGKMKVQSAQTIVNLPGLQRTASNLSHLKTTAETGFAATRKQDASDDWYLLKVLANWKAIAIKHQLSVAQFTSRCVTLYL